MVSLNDIVRVGGRSSEPELAGCNLNQLLRNRGLIDDAISEVHRETDEARREFDDVVVEMHRKSGISLDELFDSLSKDQVGTVKATQNFFCKNKTYNFSKFGKTYKR